eukprot:TRINITY_DN32582_c0_g1_i1.p1 TRINITY_DN32582_c0_g1~~TRINITY_DN32582_c0_g1_i1.p1  ORF type:complete len:693 (+),score=81.83 TRINITY_DN32582_c0_g1_i1:69-2081(+)
MSAAAVDVSSEKTVSSAWERTPSCDLGSSDQNQRIQEIAAEVLRLRLVQSQHRQLEGQLRAAAEKLQQIPPEKVLQFALYLDQGLRPGGGIGTLGGNHGGVDPESLHGLMECLCVVCDARVPSRKQDDLLAATRWLLQDPHTLIDQLASLPAAPSSQSRRLAPFLLSCDSGWRGHMSEAGQCYEAFRSWLSCYYQYSLVHGQMQANAEQLQHQEQLLDELSKEPEGSTGGPTSGFGGFCRTGPWRHPSGVRRSSSVQSNSSTGSRRSQSPSVDRAATVGLRLSPRLGNSAVGRYCGREVPSGSPLKASGRHTERTLRVNVISPTRSHSPPQEPSMQPPLSAPQTLREGQQTPLQPSSSRSSLMRGSSGIGQDKGAEPSPRAPRLGAQLTASGVLGSARAARAAAAAGAPPPSPSPSHVDPPKSISSSRRQIVPAVRARRSPSRDTPSAGTKVVGSSFLSRLTPTGVQKRLDERTADAAAAHESGRVLSPRSSSALARSKSLQSITEPPEPGATPPLSVRGPRQSAEPHSARIRCTQITPIGGRLPTSAPQPHQSRTVQTARVMRLASGAPAAGSGGTPAGAAMRRQQLSRSSVPLPSARRLGPSESATTLRHSDAGSGGTVGGDPPTASAWALATSRSTPALDMRAVSGRQVVRDTPTATPRPLASARAR